MNDPKDDIVLPGPNLRDWFAGQALCGMIGDERCGPFTTFDDAKERLKNIAIGCYAMADAMIAERGETK
jgi:hypothetical protein